MMIGLDETVSSARMSRYENGVNAPPVMIAKRIADVLEVPLAYFYCDDDRLANIILCYGQMEESEREQLAVQVQTTMARKR